MIPTVTPVTAYERDCPQCGWKVGGGYAACPQCGVKLPTPPRSNLVVALGLLLVLIGGVAMFLMYS